MSRHGSLLPASRQSWLRGLVTILILLAFAALDQVHSKYDARAIQFFSGALARASIDETVSVHGVTYEVKNGVVLQGDERVEDLDALRLAYEKATARRNPLISLAGTDPDDMDRALATLEEAQRELSGVQSDPNSARLVASSLYPIGFLRDAAELERDRNDFLANGTAEAATVYEAQLRLTISDYLNELSRYKSAFERSVPTTMRSYSTAGLLIDRQSSLHALDALTLGMEGTKREYNSRLGCFMGAITSCDDSMIALSHIASSSDPDLTAAERTQVAEVRGILGATLPITHDPRPITNATIVQLDDTACGASSDMLPLFINVIGHSWIDGSRLAAPILVSDMRLNRTTELNSIPFESYFAKRNITYVLSDPTSHYECPYVENDFATLSAVQEIAQMAASEPLSPYADPNERPAVEAIERRLSSPALITESDARAYVNAAIDLANSPDASREMKNEAAQMMLLLRYTGSGFPDMIDKVAETERRNVFALTAHNVPVDLHADTLFYYRSAFFLFFMATNQSVVGNAGPFFSTIDVPISQQPYLFYSQLPHTDATAQMLIKDLGGYFAAHRKISADSL